MLQLPVGRRRRKKQVTYDSRETYTFMGVLLILLSLFFFISIFAISENEANLFIRTRNIFGHSTPWTSIFLFSVGLSFLKVRLPFTKPISLAAQFILVWVFPALLTAFSKTPAELSRATGKDDAGGEIGFFLVKEILGDTIPTQPATKIILTATFILFLPLALSIPTSKVFAFFKKTFYIIGRASGLILTEEEKEELRKLKEAKQQDKGKKTKIPFDSKKPKTFGDFNQIIKNVKTQNKKSNINDIPKRKEQQNSLNDSTKTLPPQTSSVSNIEIKEAEIGENGLIQTELKFSSWKLPPVNLLIPYKKIKSKEAAIEQNAQIIEQILESFGIEAKVEDAFIGPSVVQYALNIPLGVKVSRVATLSENLALALGVDSKAIRIESIPDTSYLGIEVPRTQRDVVRIKEIMDAPEMQGADFVLPVPIGKGVDGRPLIAGIEKMPHLLIAGATGSGKSVLTNTFISSLLMNKSPDELRLILVDPKQVELSDYNGIPHLLTPVITDMSEVLNALKWAVNEMERRYTVLAKEQVRNIAAYNKKKGIPAMPYIVIVIDEMADMMMTSNRGETETAIVRLAQLARAVGIHLILATQRPSVNVITGLIKANIPGRIGMSVTSSTDSRVILDHIGAESLMGNGDLLYKAPDKTKAVRLQGPFIEQEEVIRIVDFIKSQAPEVEYLPEILEKNPSDNQTIDTPLGDISGDSLAEQAIRIVVASKKGSASYLQRRLNIGFNRAARLLDELEEAGVVGPANGPKPREVLIDDADSFIAQLKATKG
jgi:S-DNA-T family DNA segregation ATPase FtsK/SpoIIIE